MTQTLSHHDAATPAAPLMDAPNTAMTSDHPGAELLVWDREFEEVQYVARRDGHDVLCRVAPTWFVANANALVTGDDYVAAARAQFAEIARAIDERMLVDLFEHDGSVLLRL